MNNKRRKMNFILSQSKGNAPGIHPFKNPNKTLQNKNTRTAPPCMKNKLLKISNRKPLRVICFVLTHETPSGVPFLARNLDEQPVVKLQ
eukprot:m.49259 g.49259  ORF g.49259 m.49259 type:complete len:89 (-) comp7443_c0_seq1:69-335(-)